MSGLDALEVTLPIPRWPRRARWDLALAVLRRRTSIKVVWRMDGDAVVLASVTMATGAEVQRMLGPTIRRNR